MITKETIEHLTRFGSSFAFNPRTPQEELRRVENIKGKKDKKANKRYRRGLRKYVREMV